MDVYKIKKKHEGRTLKKGGVTVVISENLSQNQMRFILNKWGKEFIAVVKAKKDVDNKEKSIE